MKAGISDPVWSIEEIVGLLENGHEMIYIKAAAIGLVCAIVFAVGSFVVLQLPLLWEMWQAYRNPGASGIGAVGAFSFGPLVLAALVGFVLAFFWTVQSNRPTTARNDASVHDGSSLS